MDADATGLALTILRGAREILSERYRWAQGASAYDKTGERVSSRSSRAACFCASGALDRALVGAYGQSLWIQGRAYEEAEIALGEAILAITGRRMDTAMWNDAYRTTHEEVLAAFDRAINRLEAA